MTPSTLLRTAAANITDETWCQGAYEESSGRCCAVGHLDKAVLAAGKPFACEARWDADDALMGATGGDIEDWNDTPGRTAADVRALFLRVADELEAER